MLICKNCRIVMNHTTSGIIAAQQYDNNTYRGASGDLYTCPECGQEILANFGDLLIGLSKEDIDVELRHGEM